MIQSNQDAWYALRNATVRPFLLAPPQRDLKLDNTLLDGHDPPRLKLCDFGFAKGWGANSNMDTMRIGT
jgi:hypothetical protein